MLPRAIPGDTPTPWKRVSVRSLLIGGRVARMSTKEHRLSSLCAKQAFLPVSPSSHSGLKAALGAHARMPVFRHRLRLIFVEVPVDQRFDFFERARSIGSFATNLQFRSLSGRQHHQTHDALAVYFFTLFFHPHLGAKPTRHFHEKSGEPRMQTEPVHDRDFLLGLLRGGAGASFSIKQSHRDFSSPLN